LDKTKNIKILRLYLLLGAGLLFFLVGELVVRTVGEFDQSGNFVFNNRIIRPHKVPSESVATRIREFLASDESLVVYHPVLGWIPRPGGRSRDGKYRYNSAGIRSEPREYSAVPDSGVLRIALFGDSFTHGDDVPFDSTFGALLEGKLVATGVAAEVLNFGVGGYGIDQAMLRFHEQGRGFAPHIVVLGFQPENLKRNLNVLRPLYDPRTVLPFGKPRFVLSDQGLGVVNVPVLPVEQVVPTLRDLDSWELLPYEYYYDRRDYAPVWWRHSKLLATAADLLGDSRDEWLLKRILFGQSDQEWRLGRTVIQAFAEEATASGAEFLIVHLPTLQEMRLVPGLGHWSYQSYLDELDRLYRVVHPERRMLQEGAATRFTNLFAGHYTLLGNQIVADELFAHIADRTAGQDE